MTLNHEKAYAISLDLHVDQSFVGLPSQPTMRLRGQTNKALRIVQRRIGGDGISRKPFVGKSHTVSPG